MNCTYRYIKFYYSLSTQVLFFETFHVCGVFLLLYVVLPNVDVARGVMLMAGTAFVPSFMSLFLKPTESSHKSRCYKALDVFAFFGQVSALFVWFIWAANEIDNGNDYVDYDNVCNFNVSNPTNRNNQGFLHMMSLDENSTSNETMTTESYLSTAGKPTTQSYLTTAGDATTQFYLTTVGVPDLVALFEAEIWKESLANGLAWPWPWMALLPVSLFLISFTWWQNFIGDKENPGMCSSYMRKVQREVRAGKTKIYAIVNIYKVALIFAMVSLIYGLAWPEFGLFNADEIDKCGHDSGNGWLYLLTDQLGFSRDHRYKDNCEMALETDWLIAYGVQAGASLVGFLSTRWAIQGFVQKETYSIAMSLCTPFSIGFAVWMCYECDTHWDFIGVDIYWNCFAGYDGVFENSGNNPVFIGIMVGILWWASQMVITRYIWHPHVEPLANSSR